MFNAIKYTKRLEQAGFTRKQAEATLDMIHDFSDTHLATKEDIVRLEHAIEKLEYKMTIKMGSMLVIAVGLIITMQKIL